MAKINKKVLGSARKRIADIVFANLRGETIARSYQPNVANPRTSAQQLVRHRFSVLSQMAKAMSGGVYMGLGVAAKGYKMSARNLFSKLSWDATADLTLLGGLIDYSKVQVAKGGFYQTTSSTLQTDDPNTIGVPITALSVQGIDAADVDVYYVAYNAELGLGLSGNGGASNGGHFDITTPQSWNGTKVEVFLFCKYTGDDVPSLGVKKGDISDSWYAGSATIQ